MRTLAIDIETYSSVNISESGVYAYTNAPDFEILLLAYAWDDAPVRIVDLALSESIPFDVRAALTDKHIRKTAFNAAFERVCLSKLLGITLDPIEWQCTAVYSAMHGLPGKIADVGAALGLPEEKQKMTIGKALIRYFCVPCKPTKTNNGRTRNLPEHDPEKWELFKTYCCRDVVTEREIRDILQKYRFVEYETALYALDQTINDRGVKIDDALVENAIKFDRRNAAELAETAVRLTGLNNPNSLIQLKAWLQAEDADLNVGSLGKKQIPALIENAGSDAVREVLELRKEMAKTSIKKYLAMSRARCDDGKVHGLLQFYGANRTGRWAGRLVQVQNLPRNKMKDLDLARELVISGDYAVLSILYDSVSDVLSQLIRTAFIPSSGRFVVADYSAIEARVIAWLAGERWRLEVFKTHGKIYESSAAQMFRLPIESVDKELRQKGKIAELALGYGGGPGALTAMGALDMGLTEAELPGIVKAWRRANPAITTLWNDVEAAALLAVQGTPARLRYGLEFKLDRDALFIRLPSGRHLAYYKPLTTTNRFGGSAISYMGVDQRTRKWSRLETYGGKLVENIIQAIARDCLAVFLERVNSQNYDIVFHVHDEAIIDAAGGEDDLRVVLGIMCEPIDWAPGLPLKGDGFMTDYYKKD